MNSICVFLGSSPGNHPAYMETAAALGRELAARSLTCVYGGSCTGLMNQLAESALAAGGKVVGVTVQALKDREAFHKGLTELHVLPTMHERKNLMVQFADGFVALPGGFGTLEEVLEVLTWAQLGFHKKPCGLLNIEGYFDSLLLFLDKAVTEGFIRWEHRNMLLESDSPEDMLRQMESYSVPEVEKWL